MNRYKLILPYPPSANRLWRTFRGITVLSTEGREYKKLAAREAQAQRARLLTGEIGVIVYVYRPRKAGDLDNRLKALLDAVRGVCFQDDKQVVEIHAYRREDKARPRIELEVYECGQPEAV